MNISRKFIVTGIVQGVWFRSFAVDSAISLSVRGWVRNTEDGHVEVLAHGSPEDIDLFEKDLWIGPPLSQVSNVHARTSKEVPNSVGFKVIW